MCTQYLYMFLQLGVYSTYYLLLSSFRYLSRGQYNEIFKPSKFRYFYLKIYLHVRIPNVIFLDFGNNWNNIFPIMINIYYIIQIIRSLIRRLYCFSFLSPSQSGSKFLEYFSPLQNCCSFHFSAAICCRPRHNGNNGGTRKRVIVGVIFNLQPSTANSNALFSVTFGHKESLSTVINYFMGGKSISPGMGGGGRSANHGCIRT